MNHISAAIGIPVESDRVENALIQTYLNPSSSASEMVLKYENKQTPGAIRPDPFVVEQKFLNNEAYTFTYGRALLFQPDFEGALNPIPPVMPTRAVDPDGHARYFLYSFPVDPTRKIGYFASSRDALYRQVENGPRTVIDEIGREVRYNYCDRNFVYSIPGNNCRATLLQDYTLPSGLKTELYYVGFGRIGEYRQIDPTGVLPNRSIFQAYGCSEPACREKPTKITDPNGNETDMVYNTVYGSLLSKASPADDAGIRPQVRYAYSKKYAWTKSGTGYVREPDGVWLLVKEEYCRTSAATNVTVNANSVTANCAAGSSDEVVTTYEYEEGSSTKGSNLLLVGTAVTSEGETLRTCFGYDDLGRKISETKPLGTGGSCQ